ncbi:pyridoxamine 5'-phosphate oxidase family protein [bacterium]|nr:MAG: pyridoxamine 5'-phosphate oxidase family protein [bacterium]
MSKFHPELTEALQEFIAEQKIFFVGSATATSRVNVSPKGTDCLRRIDDRTYAYLDLTGSGNETSAHLHEDGRLTMMFCSFGDKPNILRLFGRGEIVPLASEEGEKMASQFNLLPGARQFVVLRVESILTSCGFSIPHFEYVGERELLTNWAANKGEESLKKYRGEKNLQSIDGLPTHLDSERYVKVEQS